MFAALLHRALRFLLRILKTIAPVLLYIVILFVVVDFFMYKRSINFNDAGFRLKAKIPFVPLVNFFSTFSVKIHSMSNSHYINLGYDLFSRPYFFLPDKENKAIFVVYEADASYHVFLVQENGNAPPNDVKWLYERARYCIQSSDGFTVRSLRDAEFIYLKSKITGMPNEQFIRFSVPNLDFGIYRLYRDKEFILSMINDRQSRTSETNNNNCDQ